MMSARGRAAIGDGSVAARTPEGIEYALRPAGPMIRAAAALIDMIIQGAVMVALLFILAFASLLTGAWILLLGLFALTWFYHAAFEILAEGQTPGKRVMGLRVVMPDGSPVSPGASFVRNLLRFADGFLYLYYVAFLSMSLSGGFKRLGDMAAGTLVVYTRSEATASARVRHISWPPGVEPLPAPRKLSYEEKRCLLIFARRYPWLGKGRADELADPWAHSLGWGPETCKAPSTYLLCLARGIAGASP